MDVLFELDEWMDVLIELNGRMDALHVSRHDVWMCLRANPFTACLPIMSPHKDRGLVKSRDVGPDQRGPCFLCITTLTATCHACLVGSKVQPVGQPTGGHLTNPSGNFQSYDSKHAISDTW
jgi:hypothetical protein